MKRAKNISDYGEYLFGIIFFGLIYFIVIRQAPSSGTAALAASAKNYLSSGEFQSYSESRIMLQVLWELPLVAWLMAKLSFIFSSDQGLAAAGVLMSAGLVALSRKFPVHEYLPLAILTALAILVALQPQLFYFCYENLFLFFSTATMILYSATYLKAKATWLLGVLLLLAYGISLLAGLTLTSAYLTFFVMDLLLKNKFYWGKFMKAHLVVFIGFVPTVLWVINNGRKLMMDSLFSNMNLLDGESQLQSVIYSTDISSYLTSFSKFLGFQDAATSDHTVFRPLLIVSMLVLVFFFAQKKRQRDLKLWSFMFAGTIMSWVVLYTLYLFQVDVSVVWFYLYVTATLLGIFIFVMFNKKTELVTFVMGRAFPVILILGLGTIAVFEKPRSYTGLKFRNSATLMKQYRSDCEVLLEEGFIPKAKQKAYSAWYWGGRTIEEIKDPFPARIAVPGSKLYWDPTQNIVWAGSGCDV